MVPGEGIFSQTAVPDFALGAYRDLVPAMNLRCLPTLVALEHANGYGGFYVDGVIAFGVADLERLADHIGSYFPVIPDEQLWWFQVHAPHRLITPQDRLRAATTALLAHELGHAWAAQHRVSQFGVAEELQADELAGQLAGSLCTRAELDHAFFHAVGCTSSISCTHPAPEDRVKAYARGRTSTDRCLPHPW